MGMIKVAQYRIVLIYLFFFNFFYVSSQVYSFEKGDSLVIKSSSEGCEIDIILSNDIYDLDSSLLESEHLGKDIKKRVYYFYVKSKNDQLIDFKIWKIKIDGEIYNLNSDMKLDYEKRLKINSSIKIISSNESCSYILPIKLLGDLYNNSE